MAVTLTLKITVAEGDAEALQGALEDIVREAEGGDHDPQYLADAYGRGFSMEGFTVVAEIQEAA